MQIKQNMTTEELEEVLRHGQENQRIDFKFSCEWSIRTFVKNILANNTGVYIKNERI